VYGVVTEFVLQTYPSPNVTHAVIQIQAASSLTNAGAEAALAASGLIASSLDEWMDAGITGTFYAAVGSTISQFVKDIDSSTMLFGTGPVTYVPLFAFDSNPQKMNATIFHAINLIQRSFGENIILKYSIPRPFSRYWYWYRQTQEDMTVAYERIQSSRLLTKEHMAANLQSLIQRILKPKSSMVGSVLVLDMVGGKGPASIPQNKRSGLNPAWRKAYIHATANTAIPDGLTTWSAKQALEDTGKWLNENTEKVWDAWAPAAGAYMHEANQFNPRWKEQFFGANYQRLWSIKKKYDPSETLFVQQGVGSHLWNYDLISGRLCQV
jgi:FAD/FMN-containing dehydrogenase